MNVSIVAPTFNESESIRLFLDEVRKSLDGHSYEIIIVDDDSPDGTWKVAAEAGACDERIRVVQRRGCRRGLGYSVMDGFRCARGDAIACIDADLQHDPAILPAMMHALSSGADMVVASRYAATGSTGHWSGVRLWGSKLATWLARNALGVNVSDPMSGYFMLRRQQFQAMGDEVNGEGFKILLELLVHLKPQRISEVPYTFRTRAAGTSKLSRRVVLAYLAQLWRLSEVAGRFPRRLVRFGVVGGLGAVVNLVVMALLIQFLGMKDWRASALATSAAVLHNYLLNNAWTFRDRMHRGHELLSGYFAYLMISLGGIAITTAAYIAITHAWRAGAHANGVPSAISLGAQAIAIVLGSCFNYVLNTKVTWRPSRVTQQVAGSQATLKSAATGELPGDNRAARRPAA